MLIEEQRQLTAQEIDRVTGEVVEGLLEEMYQNPFWEARYGERGKVHTRQDTRYHLNYLKSAILLNNPPTLSVYYHWCQGLLIYRGMCTLHLKQTLDSLAHQLARWLPDTWLIIEPFHQVSYSGLYYEHPASLALAAQQDEIARRTTERVHRAQPGNNPAVDERRRDASMRDNLYHLCYLADAVNYQYPEAFSRYLDWLNVFFPMLNLRVDDLYDDLRILADEIGRALDGEQAAVFVNLIGEKVK